MVKKLFFGKVDGYNIGKRSCAVELEAGYREFLNQKPYFTVCGNLWNNLHTDIIQGGQCIDSLYKGYPELHNGKYEVIMSLWKKNHLKSIDDISAIDKAIIREVLAV